MATPSDNTHFLVSDSNEVSSQLDSKKLSWNELGELTQNALFKKHLSIMDRYLTNSQYQTYCNTLNEYTNSLESAWEDIKDGTWSGKFKAVDGQVIIIHKDQIPAGKSPKDYLMERWDIPLDATINQWKNCMIRGVTFMSSDSAQSPIKRDSNQTVELKESNMPPHMHHSSLTTGSTTSSVAKSSAQTNSSNPVELSTRVDMFYDDSIDTGLSENELQGLDHNSFQVECTGSNELDVDDHPMVTHPNLPNLNNCYVFEIRFNGQN